MISDKQSWFLTCEEFFPLLSSRGARESASNSNAMVFAIVVAIAALALSSLSLRANIAPQIAIASERAPRETIPCAHQRRHQNSHDPQAVATEFAQKNLQALAAHLNDTVS